MPELPEVEVTRLSFAEKIKGARILAASRGKALRWPLGCRLSKLQGQIIHQVRRRGKYILLDLDEGVLLVHLGMSGRLSFLKEPKSKTKHDHFDLLTDKGNLRLHDPRRFGAVVWSASETTGMGLKLLSGLGMEPLAPSFDTERFLEGLKKRRASIKQVLLSGDLIVGVGNIYASEALYEARIDPRIAASQLSRRKALILLEKIQKILTQAIAYGGTSLKDFRNTDGQEGSFQSEVKVYGRAGQPCLNCGRSIHFIRQGQRSTFFCKYCQK